MFHGVVPVPHTLPPSSLNSTRILTIYNRANRSDSGRHTRGRVLVRPAVWQGIYMRELVAHGRWSRRDLGIVPRFDPKDWDLRVDGSVEKPLRLTYDEFLRLPSAKVTSPFHCVTGWTTFDNEWVGITIREVAERAQIRPTARFATFRCGDGYTTSHPLTVLYDSDVLLTYQWDGKPLPIEHGGPVRLLVPKRYAYKSAKWVRAVTFTDQEELGYWEVRGYSNTADPLTEDRYSF